MTLVATSGVAEMATEERSGISRRQLIKRGAVVGGAAIWVPPVVQSLRSPAFAQVGSPPPATCIVDGFMTGAGAGTSTSGVKVSYDLRSLDCPPLESPPELKISWSTGQAPNKLNYDFELTAFTARVCTDNPAIPNGAEANFDTASGSGTGTLSINGVDQAGSVDFTFVDDGEGNGAGDSAALTVYDAANVAVITVPLQVITQGNLQAHKGNRAVGDACNNR